MQIFVKGEDALFIHVPKTGGNTIQQAFLQASCTPDSLLLSGHQDGVNRFEIFGPNTFAKHQSLSQYQDLWPAARTCPIYISFRSPLERLLSLYFSPHRWYRLDAETGLYELPSYIDFDISEFADLVVNSPSAADCLASGTPGSQTLECLQAIFAANRLYVLRTDCIAADFRRYFGWKLETSARNVSPFRDQARSLLGSLELSSIIANSHHRLDYCIIHYMSK